MAPRGSTFSSREEVKLARAWVTVSEDPIRGNSQKKEAFWRRIAGIFNEDCEDEGGRTQKSLQSKYSEMQKLIVKFVGAMNKSKSVIRSGWNETNYMEEAMAIFADSFTPPRTFEHLEAWHVLERSPKWQASMSTGLAPSRGPTPVHVRMEDTLPRPAGHKATKRHVQSEAARKEVETKRQMANEKVAAAMEEKNRIMEDQAAISFFRGRDDQEANEFRALKQKQYLLRARRQLDADELDMAARSSCHPDTDEWSNFDLNE